MKNRKKFLAKEFMCPNHERWYEFVVAMLDRYEDCDHTHKITQAILQEMQGIDVDGTLKFLKNEGGYCDCEVLLNVVTKNVPPKLIYQLMYQFLFGGMQGDEQEALDDGAGHPEAPGSKGGFDAVEGLHV